MKQMSIIIFFLLISICYSQDQQASLLLDLKRARSSFEVAKQKFENDKKLFEKKAISGDEFNSSKNQLLSAEVEYQKLILNVVAQQSYIIVEKAVKYQNDNGNRRVKVTLRSTMEGNQEYLKLFKEHFDIFTPEMRSGKIYNVFISLVNISDNTIIGSPYEIRIPYIDLGKSATVDFALLKDTESLQVDMNYGNRKDKKNIYLEKDASANIVDINSLQFSQEADLGDQAIFDLTLERFSSSDDVYRLLVLNLPRQISYEFIDPETQARLSQVKFNQGVNIRKLVLKIYLPDRDDDDIVIDKPISFYVLGLNNDQYDDLNIMISKEYSDQDITLMQCGNVRLEIIPRGVGRIEVRAPSLYHEISAGEQVSMEITIRNNGTRRLNNIKISTDQPLHWRSNLSPDLIKVLEPEKEQIVKMQLMPPADVSVGAQEVKIKTEALADNKQVETEDKTVRIQIVARTPILWTTLLILLLLGLIVGIIVFGIKISRR